MLFDENEAHESVELEVAGLIKTEEAYKGITTRPDPAECIVAEVITTKLPTGNFLVLMLTLNQNSEEDIMTMKKNEIANDNYLIRAHLEGMKDLIDKSDRKYKDFSAEWNSDLIGYVLTFKDGKIAHTQQYVESNRLDAGFGKDYLARYDGYDDDLTDTQHVLVEDFVEIVNSEIAAERN